MFEDGSIWSHEDLVDLTQIQYGTEADDQIIGDDTNNSIKAFAGDDLIDGGLGADRMSGGNGSDSYFVDNEGDEVVELDNTDGIADIDTVYSSISRILSDNVENLILINEAESGEGNSLSNYLAGNDLDNHLFGHEGNDAIKGGLGDDTIDGGSGVNTILYSSGDGNDTIQSSDGYYTLGLSDISEQDAELSINNSGLLIQFSTLSGGSILFDGLVEENSENTLSLLQIEFSESTILDWQAISDKVEYLYADTRGTEADDTLQLTTGGRLATFAGNDNLTGSGGADTIVSGAGDDWVDSAAGDDLLFGGAGLDVLRGGDGNDMLDGGFGYDIMRGGQGNDTYLFNLGDGKDVIYDDSGDNTLAFGEGIDSTDLRIEKRGADLAIVYGPEDEITLSSYFANETVVDTLVFDTQAATTLSELMVQNPIYIAGTSMIDQIRALEGYQNNISAGSGDDQAWGSTMADEIDGGSGDDQLYGGDGDDVLAGGQGSDFLDGGAGNDVYLFTVGDGQDQIASSQGSDTLNFGSEVDINDLWFERAGDNLAIYITGTEDSVTLDSWFTSEDRSSIDSSMHHLSEQSIESLVQAMSAFGAVGSGAISLSSEQEEQVSALVAANWQSNS